MKPLLSCAIILTFSIGALSAAYADSATWRLNPINGDWNTAANWIPATVPDGPSDVATLADSSISGVALSSDIELDSIIFNPGANAFTATVSPGFAFTISGAGVTNGSGAGQTFVTQAGADGSRGEIDFTGSANAGSDTVFINHHGTAALYPAGLTSFLETASAGYATLINEATPNIALGNGETLFFDRSTADHSVITSQGTSTAGGGGGAIVFIDRATAAQSTIICEAGVPNYGSGVVTFFHVATAADSTLIANAGTSGLIGGRIFFVDDARGSNARIQLLANSTLDLTLHSPNISLGSVEGEGTILLADLMTCYIGANSRDTVFSGIIKEGGISLKPAGIVKVGRGTLTLTNVNTYSGGTTIHEGQLIVTNTVSSSTGPGPVVVVRGALGGGGMIEGQVTVGTGTGSRAVLGPSAGDRRPTTMRISAQLDFGVDGTYAPRIFPDRRRADAVIASGVTIANGAPFSFKSANNQTIAAGTVFTLIDNTAATPIAGTFANLADGSTITIGSNNFQASYEGGDGNDLTLTVVP